MYKELYIPLNLQFFAETSSEKTEKPTSKKRGKARDEGQVAKSQEVSTAFLLLSGFFALRLFAGGILDGMLGLFNHQINLINVGMDYMEQVTVARQVSWIFGQILLMCMPILIVGVVVGVIVNILQVKWKITTKPMRPKFSKLNPLKGFKRILSMQSLINLVKSLLKLTIIGTVVFFILRGAMEETLPILLFMELGQGITVIGGIVINMGLSIGAAYLLIAAFDYAYTKWKHEKDLKMTKHEVKEEHKQQEGDPQVKSKIKQKQREISMRRMMQNVPQADVIITNPTHYAVALKYDLLGPLSAPVLVAKGVDYMARRIKEAGIEHGIHIVENPPLARAIYDDVEIDREIPEELYVAVAEIMAYVFQLKNKV
jgi:flagellar biosynthetic protein FlhB